MARPARKNPAKKPATHRGALVGESVDVSEDLVTAAPMLPKLPRTAAFQLAFHPRRWCVLKGRVVPMLANVPEIAGVNCAASLGKGRVSLAATYSKWTAAGWTIIPKAAGPGGASYIVRHPVAQGHVHVTRWTKVYPGSPKTSVDVDGYADWIDSLFAEGVLPAPQLHALQGLRADIAGELAKVADKATLAPSKQVLVTRLTADLAAVDAYIEKVAEGMEEEDEPEPLAGEDA